MTAPLTAAEQAQLDAFEAAGYAEEALRERMAAAMYVETEAAEYQDWPDATPAVQAYCRRLADAALAVVRTPVALAAAAPAERTER